ncbi:MAG: TlpA family protein disulfide reductase [Kofleriaceae bacterium]|nr:TlpA family protein disulfide reductase [Kofleriaceae bacterium]
MQYSFSNYSLSISLILGTALSFSCSGTRDIATNSPTSEPGDAVATDNSSGSSDTATASTPDPNRKARYRKSGSKVVVGDKALDLSGAIDDNGNPVSLESYQAPVLVLTFGASWCAPCKKEIPALDKIAQGFDSSKVDFVAVNIDTSVKSGTKFMNSFGLTRVRSVFDPKNKSVRRYDPPTMPSVFIVREGIVKHVHAGFRSGDADKFKKLIDGLVQ